MDGSVRRIERALSENEKAGHHAVVTVDEAHLLRDMGTLETMRLLLNFQVESQPALTLLLVGQPSLLANLDRMPGLEERLGVKCLLRPFTEEETISYVTHRLTDSDGRYVCWTGRLKTREEARQVAAAWADKTEDYILRDDRF